MKLPEKWHKLASRLAPRQQQYLMAVGILASGVGIFWLVLALSAGDTSRATPAPERGKGKTVVKPEQDGVTPLRVDPVDQWVGTAGKALAQYTVDKEAQERINAERKAGEQSLMERLAEVERRQQEPGPEAAVAPALPVAPERASAQMRPPVMPSAAAQGPRPQVGPSDMPGFPPGTPAAPLPVPVSGTASQAEPPPALVRVNLAAPGPAAKAAKGEGEGGSEDAQDDDGTLETYLPVGFIRGELLTGIMAPTGGQAQGDPLPVLIRLLDNAVLPNHYRGEVRECFVIASGYGRVSDSRAYMRTVNLSCIRRDGRPQPLEVKIEGNVLGEDGMLGVQGRLVTMQGQMLANALRAGIVSGIGQGFAQGGSTFTATPFGTLATSQEGLGDRMQRGVAGGVGRALDNLANYYIKLAEATFPVVEVNAKREVHIMLTKGVKLPRLAGEARHAVDD
ncbi:MAG: conjugal transfer protein TraB [Burkholderiaceae bacterium]|nr:conjugal transfer protein TraB [Burkholderiaceae bacterium]